jgi:hypothetical protein
MALDPFNAIRAAGKRIELSVSSKASQDALAAAIRAGTVVVDSARRRPLYFDGRFLTAADLIADQNYMRTRQADLAQAIGTGVVSGLMVSLGKGATANNPEIVIDPGLGITPAGDLVSLESEQRLRLNAIPEAQTLDAQLGVKLLPAAAIANRSGLFVLALRPVEFSANPVPAYPTTLDGHRSVHDGDIVEATAITLIPYPDRAGSESADAKRARVTREIFFEQQRPGVLQEALPLALLQLDGGALRWLDVFMVRREVGAESTLAAGLRQRPRVLVESWLRQHQDQIEDLDPTTVDAGFAATRYFEVLPPVGLVPASTLRFETQLGRPTLVQTFFPPVVDCEFTFVASDEVAALVDDALGMPPIDLRAGDEDLDRLSVLILAPVTRQTLERIKRDLASVSRLVRTAAPGMIAKRQPLEALLRIADPRVVTPVIPEDQALAKAWEAALASAQDAVKKSNRGCFWFLRRRQLPYYAEVSSATLRLAGKAEVLDAELKERLAKDKVEAVFKPIREGMATLAAAETVNLLAAPRLAVSPTLSKGVLATSDLLRRSAFTSLVGVASANPEKPVEHGDVLGIARRFGDPRLGEGFDSLREQADEATRKALATEPVVKAVADSGVAPELDKAVRALPLAEHAGFAAKLAKFAAEGRIEDIKAMAGERVK